VASVTGTVASKKQI